MFKSGFVSIIGRTNVGKSSIINSLVGEKVSAIANKPQTTRKNVKAIINRENSQIIFIDTPGIHKPKTKLGNTMIETVWASVPNSDVTLFIIDATLDKIGIGDKIILDKIKELKRKTILVINKIDLIEKEKLFKVIELYKNEYEFEAIIPVSSLENDNTEVILKEIEKAILASDIGINPNNDGKVIRLAFPELTEERRKELVKDIKKMAEDCKVAVRNARRDGIDQAKKEQKDGELTEDELKQAENKIQELTDKAIEEVDKVLANKENEILSI